MIFTGEICVYSGRPIVVDDKNPQLARCRKCGAPYLSQSWFAAGEKCVVPGCDGKAADFGPPKVKDAIGEVCPFLPPDPPRREGDSATPARCLKAKCALFDGVERRCSLGEIAYTLATVRQGGRQTRHMLNQAVGNSSKQTVQLLNLLVNSSRSTEKEIKGLAEPQDKVRAAMDNVASLLGDVKDSIGLLATDQQGVAEGFDRLAGAVEASGVGERVRGRREARLAARAALSDGRPGAAIHLLEQAEKRTPDLAVRNDLATALVARGELDPARDVLQGILEIQPEYTQARITLATLHLRGGRAAEAEELLRDAPEPANPQLKAELLYAQACVAYAVGRSEDSVLMLNRALDEDPWHADAAASLSDLRARREGAAVPEPAAIALEGHEHGGGADG
ncbi:MAG: tetratricopeptide repeat protein [Planctomycetota bacterium]